MSKKLLSVNLHTADVSKPVISGPVIYFCNHRSWADFFLDSALLGGCSYLARYMVACAVPFPSLIGWLTAV